MDKRKLGSFYLKWAAHRNRDFNQYNIDQTAYHPLFINALDGIILFNSQGTIQVVNPAANMILGGMGAQDLLHGRNIREIVAPSSWDNFLANLELFLYVQKNIGFIEMELCNFQGEYIPVVVSISSLTSATADLLQLTIRDNSEWKQINEHLLNANMKLGQAYQETLEGWGRALELRDYETEGHTRRVTEATVNLSISMGLPIEDIVNIRHGAMLHDIGKMGIPDAILLKPGPLTTDEWAIMKLHPTYARNMLVGIDYLKPAITIPFLHHEKWDGSGYPNGMAGEEIPIAARIFAIVDVWDALLSNRPYRKGWKKPQVHQYIRDNAGIHFDPQIVDLFLTCYQ